MPPSGGVGNIYVWKKKTIMFIVPQMEISFCGVMGVCPHAKPLYRTSPISLSHNLLEFLTSQLFRFAGLSRARGVFESRRAAEQSSRKCLPEPVACAAGITPTELSHHGPLCLPQFYVVTRVVSTSLTLLCHHTIFFSVVLHSSRRIGAGGQRLG